MLREAERDELRDTLAHPLIVAREGRGIEGHHDDRARLDGRIRGATRNEDDERRDDEHRQTNTVSAGADHRRSSRPTRLRVRPLSLPINHPTEPAPSRRSAISGSIITATSPTSQCQISTEIRDW